MHILESGPGRLVVVYRSRIQTPGNPGAGGETADDGARPDPRYERQVYLRPSRYCPSDHLIGFAAAQFGTGPDVVARVAAITSWIRQRIGYVPGSSSVHDSAEDTLLTGMGTCRDFAHLGIALCRATGVPARFVAVYAPGLSPMDFHAVFEAFENGRWYVYDSTGLAPRRSLVRIVTGRDAADAAFAATTRGSADLEGIEVSATVASSLPADDVWETVEMA
jgi:transglutaminase-like putative cysteine protease